MWDRSTTVRGHAADEGECAQGHVRYGLRKICLLCTPAGHNRTGTRFEADSVRSCEGTEHAIVECGTVRRARVSTLLIRFHSEAVSCTSNSHIPVGAK